MQAKNQPVVALLQYGRYPGFVLAMMAGKADRYKTPADLKGMPVEQLPALAAEIR